MLKLFWALSIFHFSIILLNSQKCTPQGVRLAFGNYYFHTEYANNTELIKITFHTISECNNVYGTIVDSSSNKTITKVKELTNDVYGFNITDNSKGYLEITMIYIHTFRVMGPLDFNKKYFYTIHPNETSSDVDRTFNFILPPRDVKNTTNKDINIVFTGMLDISNQSNITQLYLNDFAQRMNTTSIDAIVYLGDMGFNLDTNIYQTGINFFKSIENFTAYIPFMPTPGIRDNANNYEFYTKMINTPDDNLYNDFYYAFNLGYAHFVQINMAYYFGGADDSTKTQLLTWLKNDLKLANTKANRMIRPWVIVYGYHSIYCSNTTDPFCGSHDGTATGISGFEDLFNNYNVDLYISASYLPVYERTKPLIRKKEYSFSSNIAYDVKFSQMINPTATIYLIDAAAGNYLFFNGQTDLSKNLQTYDKGIYSLTTDPYQGIGIMTIKSGTEIQFTQITTESYTLEVTDNFTLINTLSKWNDDWPSNDKATFISAAVVFTVLGGAILIIFMLNLE